MSIWENGSIFAKILFQKSHYPTSMRKLLLFAYICAAAIGVTTGCRFAHEEPLGDTVAASVFAPKDTAAINKKKKASFKTEE